MPAGRWHPLGLPADVRGSDLPPGRVQISSKGTHQTTCQLGGSIIGVYMLPDALLFSRLIFSCVAFLMANAREFLGMTSRIVSVYTNMQ